MIVYPEFYTKANQLYSIKSMNVYYTGGGVRVVTIPTGPQFYRTALETREFRKFRIDVGDYDRQHYRLSATNSIKSGFGIFLIEIYSGILHFASPTQGGYNLYHLFIDCGEGDYVIHMSTENLIDYIYDYDMIGTRDPRLLNRI